MPVARERVAVDIALLCIVQVYDAEWHVDIPGGKRQLCETSLDTAVREALEEVMLALPIVPRFRVVEEQELAGLDEAHGLTLRLYHFCDVGVNREGSGKVSHVWLLSPPIAAHDSASGIRTRQFRPATSIEIMDLGNWRAVGSRRGAAWWGSATRPLPASPSSAGGVASGAGSASPAAGTGSFMGAFAALRVGGGGGGAMPFAAGGAGATTAAASAPPLAAAGGASAWKPGGGSWRAREAAREAAAAAAAAVPAALGNAAVDGGSGRGGDAVSPATPGSAGSTGASGTGDGKYVPPQRRGAAVAASGSGGGGSGSGDRDGGVDASVSPPFSSHGRGAPPPPSLVAGAGAGSSGVGGGRRTWGGDRAERGREGSASGFRGTAGAEGGEKRSTGGKW
jgi:hypothetical protein